MIKATRYIFVTILLMCHLILSGQVREYVAKASLIYQMAEQYIKWPNDTVSTFNICIAGNHEFYEAFDLAIKEEKVTIHGKQIQLIYSEDGEVDTPIHLIFLSHNQRRKFESIYNYYFDKKTLIVTESKGYCEKGAHIRLYINIKGSHSLEISENSIKRSGFIVDPLLLEFADIIK